jgi:hypothetical protein
LPVVKVKGESARTNLLAGATFARRPDVSLISMALSVVRQLERNLSATAVFARNQKLMDSK